MGQTLTKRAQAEDTPHETLTKRTEAGDAPEETLTERAEAADAPDESPTKRAEAGDTPDSPSWELIPDEEVEDWREKLLNRILIRNGKSVALQSALDAIGEHEVYLDESLSPQPVVPGSEHEWWINYHRESLAELRERIERLSQRTPSAEDFDVDDITINRLIWLPDFTYTGYQVDRLRIDVDNDGRVVMVIRG